MDVMKHCNLPIKTESNEAGVWPQRVNDALIRLGYVQRPRVRGKGKVGRYVEDAELWVTMEKTRGPLLDKHWFDEKPVRSNTLPHKVYIKKGTSPYFTRNSKEEVHYTGLFISKGRMESGDCYLLGGCWISFSSLTPYLTTQPHILFSSSLPETGTTREEFTIICRDLPSSRSSQEGEEVRSRDFTLTRALSISTMTIITSKQCVHPRLSSHLSSLYSPTSYESSRL
jgi:hypothetical protein